MVVCAAACGGADPKLAALEDEAIAQFIPPGGRLHYSTASPAEESTFYKPSNAIVLRSFEYDDADAARRGWKAALAAARRSGWTFDVDADYASGKKQLETGAVRLGVGFVRRSGVFRVSIYLQHG